MDRTRLEIDALEDRLAPATLVGLTSTDQLITFDSATPNAIARTVKIKGVGGEDVVSIDARPADGLVYALTKANRLYTVNPFTGKATRVGTDPSNFSLGGGRVGLDFNPSVDRLRVTTAQVQNFRVNPNNGTLAGTDTNLTSTAGNPTIVETAYDRNFQGTALTTLYGIDATLNALVLIGGVDGTPSPNVGGVSTVGSLNANPGNRVGFDIDAFGTAYAAFRGGNGTGTLKLFTVDLDTGAATNRGAIGNGTLELDGLTALPREEIVYAVTASNRLISFRADDPGRILSAVALQGLIAGENVTDIDFRPATGELFALTSMNRMLRIDTAGGQTVQLGSQIDPALFSTFGNRGFDFNPTVDRLRLVNAADTNFRYNPLTFALVDSDNNAVNGTTPDTSLAFDAGDANAGDDPIIVGAAYDRNDNDAATGTTLWAIDTGNNALVTQGGLNGTPSPNGGLLFSVGTLIDGLGATVNVGDTVGFDIAGAGSLGNGVALMTAQVVGETTHSLFSVNLNSTGITNQPRGSVKRLGAIGSPEVIRAMAIAPPQIQFKKGSFSVNEAAGTATITITRSGGNHGDLAFSLFTFGGDATPGDDYAPSSPLTTVLFPPGQTTVKLTISIANDTAVEAPETVQLNLAMSTSSNHPATIGPISTATLTIVSDE